MVEQEEAQKTRNWADVNEEAEEDGEGEAIGQSPLPQTEEQPEVKKIVPPPEKRVKNKYGDFVVTKVFVKEVEVAKTVAPQLEESEEEESSEEEEPQKEEEEEVKSK